MSKQTLNLIKWVAFIAVCALMGYLVSSNSISPVRMNADKTATWEPGGYCVISMTEEDTSIMELNERFIWCQMKHDEWLQSR